MLKFFIIDVYIDDLLILGSTCEIIVNSGQKVVKPSIN